MVIATALEPLTGMQRHFVRAYIELGNGSQAAREAGYAANSAGQQALELLRKPHIIAAIEESRELAKKRSRINIDGLLIELYGVYERARELDKLDTANRSLELLLKHLGAFPRPEVNIDARNQQAWMLTPELVAQLGIDGLRQLARGDVAMLPEGDSRGGDTPDPPYIEHPKVDVMQSSGNDSRDDASPATDATET